jgi:hypothetical protein
MLLLAQALTQRTASLLSEQVPESTGNEEISDALSYPDLGGYNPDVIDYPKCSTSFDKLPQVEPTRVTKDAFIKARVDAMLRYREKKKHRQ